MILFQQAQPIDGQELTVHKEELFIARMMAAFGSLPATLDKHHLERLEGMKAATLGEQSANPYDELIRAIKRYGSVVVFVKFDPNEEPCEK